MSPSTRPGAVRRSRFSQRVPWPLGRKSVFLTADLSDSHTAPDLVERAEAELGPLDILVNNAGIITRSPAAEYPEEDWAAVLAVNLSSVSRLDQPREDGCWHATPGARS